MVKTGFGCLADCLQHSLLGDVNCIVQLQSSQDLAMQLCGGTHVVSVAVLERSNDSTCRIHATEV